MDEIGIKLFTLHRAELGLISASAHGPQALPALPSPLEGKNMVNNVYNNF